MSDERLPRLERTNTRPSVGAEGVPAPGLTGVASLQPRERVREGSCAPRFCPLLPSLSTLSLRWREVTDAPPSAMGVAVQSMPPILGRASELASPVACPSTPPARMRKPPGAPASVPDFGRAGRSPAPRPGLGMANVSPPCHREAGAVDERSSPVPRPRSSMLSSRSMEAPRSAAGVSRGGEGRGMPPSAPPRRRLELCMSEMVSTLPSSRSPTPSSRFSPVASGMTGAAGAGAGAGVALRARAAATAALMLAAVLGRAEGM